MVSRMGNSSGNVRSLGVMLRLTHPAGRYLAWERRHMKTGVLSHDIGAETAGGLRNVLGGRGTGNYKGADQRVKVSPQ